MDKLGTYALVAALREISKKNVQQRASNERWVSLRSCMTDLENQTLDAPAAQNQPQQNEPSGRAALPRRKTFSYIQQIDAKHQRARKLLK